MGSELTAQQREEIQQWQRRDWTVDVETGRSNSSTAFRDLVVDIERIIRDSAHSLINGRADNVAGSILAHLIHRHGLMMVSGFGVSEDGKVSGRVYYRDRFAPIQGQLSDVPESLELVDN